MPLGADSRPWLDRELRLRRGRHPDDVALGVCEDPERYAGHVLRRLDRPPAELLGPLERRLDIVDAYEEEDGVGAALQRSDRGRERTVGAGVRERVAGKGPIGIRPAEQLTEERASRVGVLRADLGMNDGMCHDTFSF